MSKALQFVVLNAAGWLGRQQQEVKDYLLAENRVLREKVGKKPIRFTDAQRRQWNPPTWFGDVRASAGSPTTTTGTRSERSTEYLHPSTTGRRHERSADYSHPSGLPTGR